MPDITELDAFLASASVADEVFALRPDYRALLIAADGIEPGAGDDAGEALLVRAEEWARRATAGTPVEQLPHIAAWRDAFRGFGAKPQRTRTSVEALTRRAVTGLPRINRLTDLYNAISVLHQLPIGGENLRNYAGAPRLIRATGDEPFDTVAGGEPAIEHPETGEVIWCDDAGVTCRRWNWRQGRRTQLTDATSAVLFILDVLDPMTDDELETAADELAGQLRRLGSDVVTTRRLIARPSTQEPR
ncbi:MAG: phenylalanine--tRNA ligase beta subunit-related protein [Micropruina sp.]|uniref:B3/B4 domain-containing protein n=1 Tax=Micropruina sp. TaxID=2737536 RepID=UPI0039E70CCF